MPLKKVGVSRSTRMPTALRKRLSVVAVVTTVAATIFSLVCQVSAGAVVLRDIGNGASAPSVAAPSLEQLDQTIALSEQYLAGLYRQLSPTTAVQSETYGLPLKAFFTNERRWALAGEGARGQCLASSCAPTSTITALAADGSDEAYRMTLASPESSSSVTFTVRIVWGHGQESTQIHLAVEQATAAGEIWLDQQRIVRFLSSQTISVVSKIPQKQLGAFRTLRYTVRHAVQEAYLYYSIRGDRTRAGQLAAFLGQNGYVPGYDERAPLFGMARQLPDNLPFNEQAYPDCKHLPDADSQSYPYASRACLGLEPFLVAGQRDPLLQATLALHILQKYGPENSYDMPKPQRLWLQADTPAETANHLRGQWNRTGFGIPTCTPATCQNGLASGIRTFTYGALETTLGYSHGDAIARRYADAAAAITVATQIKSDGIVRMQTGSAYRPNQVGAFPVAWDTDDGRFAPPNDRSIIGGAMALASGYAAMPPEYLGIQPSNSETTLDAWAFLVRYRYAKYGTGYAVKG